MTSSPKGAWTPTEESSTSFPNALEQFPGAYRRQKASAAAKSECLLRGHLSFSGDICAIMTRDLTPTIDQIGSPKERLHGFVAAKTLFSWFAKRRMIPGSPLAGVDFPYRTQPRERLLTDAQFVELWRSLEKGAGRG